MTTATIEPNIAGYSKEALVKMERLERAVYLAKRYHASQTPDLQKQRAEAWENIKALITVQDKFRDLLRPLDGEEFNQLEKGILRDGCQDPLRYYVNAESQIVLLDGHNRLNICKKHQVPFEISLIESLKSEEQALDWLISHQLGRRNLTAEERAYLLGKRYNAAKDSQGGARVKSLSETYDEPGQKAKDHFDPLKTTAEKIAQEANSSQATVKRAGKFAAAVDRVGEVSPEAKAAILSGDHKLKKADIEKLADAEPERIQEAAEIALQGDRHKLSAVFSSDKDDWETPPDLFEALDAEFGFSVDVCASAHNSKVPINFFDVTENGLAKSWAAADVGGGPVWCNPPYSQKDQWIEKAFWTAFHGMNTVVMLIPAKTDTAAWWDFCALAEVRFLPGRLVFVGAENGAPFPAAIVVFREEMFQKNYKPRTLYWDWEGKKDKDLKQLGTEHDTRNYINCGSARQIHNALFLKPDAESDPSGPWERRLLPNGMRRRD